MTDLTIIGVPFSNYVRSVRMLCEEKGVPYALEPAAPHSPQVNEIHPEGQVPCMQHGDLKLFESKAIATYIDRAFDGPKMVPDDNAQAAKVEQWVSYGNVKVDRVIMREFVVPMVFADKEKGPNMDKINAALPKIERCCATLDAAVADTGYMVGDGMTYADCNVVPMLASLQNFPQGKEIIAKFPHLSAYIEKQTARDSFVKTAPPPRN